MSYIKHKGNKYSKFMTSSLFCYMMKLFVLLILLTSICVLEMLLNGLHSSSQPYIQWSPTGSLNSVKVGEFTP